MTGDPAYTRSAVKALSTAVDTEHDFPGWLAAVLARVAARAGSADALTAGRPGSWEAALVEQLVKGTVGYGDDEHLPDSDGLDDHARPGLADMRAALLVTRAILDSADDTAHQEAAEGGSCPACVAMAAISYGTTLATTMAGDTGFMSEPVRLRLLAAVDATLRRTRLRGELTRGGLR